MLLLNKIKKKIPPKKNFAQSCLADLYNIFYLVAVGKK